ncbi:MAG: P-loop ATPase, Sll1717 family [Brevundimonas sp.]|uniref:P-loop ATPase, Sll1717 family n=1 Tax=Brevundimonas sp. TaxID=1871086 RepID=UPI004033C0ED
MSQQRSKNPIVLKKGQIVGEPAAEDDDDFLFKTFYEHYAYKALTDIGGPRFLLVGRTGTGKTAVLRQLEENNERVIRISPEELSLQYISNSDILTYFQDRGVKLDLFYQLLWRHVLATELIKHKFKLNDEGRTKQFFSDIPNIFSSKRRRAMEYMRSFGSDFWLETDARVTQVTQKFENELNAATKLDVDFANAGLEGRSVQSEEVVKEVIHRAQRVVDSIHLQQLSDVIDWLGEVFDDDQKPVYVVIDDLDLNFAHGDIKLWLIRALIETCKKFKSVRNVKVVVALRSDLIERVFETTRDDGFQEEKYKGNIVELEWGLGELKELIDRRIKESIRRQYSGSKIGYVDIFPERINQSESFPYIIQRTLRRPRDVIAFVNECIDQAVGSDRISLPAIRKAEEPYSVDRFNALRDEWRGHFPLLEKYCKPLVGRPRRFLAKSLSEVEVEELMLELAVSNMEGKDRLANTAAKIVSDARCQISEFEFQWLDALYKVGVVGLKTDPSTPVKWNYKGRQGLSDSDVNAESIIYVHPMLWRRLGVQTKEQGLTQDENW